MRRRVRRSVVAATVALVSGIGATMPALAAKPTARAASIARAVAGAYGAVQTLSLKSHGETYRYAEGGWDVSSRETLEFRFQRPNRFYYHLRSETEHGTTESIAVCDGKTELLYMPKFKVYYRFPAPRTLREASDPLWSLHPEMSALAYGGITGKLRVSDTPPLNPGPAARYRGELCDTLVGRSHGSESWMRESFTVDRRSHLVILYTSATYRLDRKSTPWSRETVSVDELNTHPTFIDDDFKFVPPPDATEASLPK